MDTNHRNNAQHHVQLQNAVTDTKQQRFLILKPREQRELLMWCTKTVEKGTEKGKVNCQVALIAAMTKRVAFHRHQSPRLWEGVQGQATRPSQTQFCSANKQPYTRHIGKENVTCERHHSPSVPGWGIWGCRTNAIYPLPFSNSKVRHNYSQVSPATGRADGEILWLGNMLLLLRKLF